MQSKRSSALSLGLAALLTAGCAWARPAPAPRSPAQRRPSHAPSHARAAARPPASRPAQPAPLRDPGEAAVRPAGRLADLDPASCYAELARRGIRWKPVKGGARGVLAPIRLDGPLGGVSFHTELPESKRASSPWEVMDCRLALALHGWSATLLAHGIDEVTTFSAWRPPAKSWPAGRAADRHPGGLALDVRRLRQHGSWIVVESDFHGKIGHRVCGPDADPPTEDVPAAHELRALVCETAETGIFNTILTPDHDRPHENHLHVDIQPRASWRMVE